MIGKIKLVFFILLLILPGSILLAQHKNPFGNYELTRNNNYGDSEITYKNILVDLPYSNPPDYLFDTLPWSVKRHDSSGLTLTKGLRFEKCIFQGSINREYPKIYNFFNVKLDKTSSFKNCTFTNNNFFENIKTADNYEPFLFIENAVDILNLANINGKISFTKNSIQTQIGVYDSKIKDLFCMGNSFTTDSASFEFVNSTIGFVSLTDHNSKSGKYRFDNDTLTEKFLIMGEAKAGEKMEPLGIVFTNCYIDFQLLSFYKNRELFFIFRKCSFGKNFDLNGAQINSLMLDSCYNFEKPLDLNNINSEETILSIGNTDLTKLNLNYTGKFKLYFTDNVSKDYILGTYENMLAKFKAEGKLESYENFDIDYKQYKYSNEGFWGFVKGSIDDAWWHYGYKKYYIIYWTFLFLFAFFIYNAVHWKELQHTYPILETANNEKSSVRYFRKSVWASAMKVFIFTCVIFFSLKIDLTILSYKHMKVVKWFFIQYLVGLICVFFLANAILKL